MADTNKYSAALETQGTLFLEGCPSYVALLDSQWVIVYANPAFQERLCSRKHCVGTSFLSYLDDPSASRLRDVQPLTLVGNRQMELTHLAGDSKAVSIQYSFFALPGSGGETLLAAMGRDRTADLATLLELIQLNLDLERKQKELSEANARLEQLAITDQLTELYNRHYFFQVAQHFWEESKRYKLPLTLMMMDIDNFKFVNDNYGHLFGDFVLGQASQRLKNNTRKSDILARYGGEEFIVLASNTDIQTGQVLAERLRLAMTSQTFVMGSCSAVVTISVGISGTELSDFASFEALLDSSDRALYGAKQAGKNCVYSFDQLARR